MSRDVAAAISAPPDTAALRLRAFVDVLTLILVVFLPAIITVELLVAFAHAGRLAVDFHFSYWAGARDVLHGHSPLPLPRSDAPTHGALYPVGPYPAPVPVLFVPFGLLPLHVASVLFTALLAAAVLASLYLLEVRDWRCYGIVFASAPVFAGLQSANLSLVFVLVIAVLWRARDRVITTGLTLGVALALKLFLWPLAVWLVLTRRTRAACWSVGIALAVTLASWSVIGFASLRTYPDVLRIYSQHFGRIAYTPYAFFLKLGASSSAAQVAALFILVVVIAALFVTARRAREETSFSLAILAAVLATPIVWLHYFALGIVPLALFRPRFGLAWLLPAALWICPIAGAHPAWRVLFPFAVYAVALAAATHGRWSRPASRAT